MAKFPYLVLFYTLTLPSMALANSFCDNLFTKLIKSEPYIETELQGLKSSCDQQVSSDDIHYWACVHKRMEEGAMNFDRFIVSAHLCETQEPMVSIK